MRRKARSFIREKKIYCGKKYLEVDIIPASDFVPAGRRSRKENVTPPKIKNLHEKNARRYFVQLLNTNFGKGDLNVTLTYNPEHLPDSIEAAQKEIAKFIRRVRARRKKEGLEPLKYIIVTECTSKDGVPIRIHHHVIMNAGLDRDTVENLWKTKNGDPIGFANADRLQPDEKHGLEALARYLTKAGARAKSQRRWSSSHNLEKPYSRNNDHRYSRRKVEKIAREEVNNPAFWEKQYPGYHLTEVKPEYNDYTGWSIYLKLYRKENVKGERRNE